MTAFLRTLHVDTERTWRGGQQQVFYLATGLRERGHMADIVCQPRSALADRARAAGLAVHQLSMRGEGDVLASARLALRMARGRYDIVHSHTSHAHAIAGTASHFLIRRPKRVASRRVVTPLRRTWFERLKYRRGADLYIAISQAVKRTMVEGGVAADRVRVVYSCTDLARLEHVEAGDVRSEFGLPADSALVVCVAYLVEPKAQRHLVDAMPEVVRRCLKAYCLLIGEGDQRKNLEAQVERLGLVGRVIFTGFREDALRFIKAADVFVMASQEEGLCNSVMEALALRRPVVVTDAGGLPEVVENGVNGLVVQRRDSAALADAIIRVLSDPGAAERYGEAARRIVAERFDRGRMVEGTLAVYRELFQPR